jgi:mono/diheme cytochrome c family protein
MTLRNARNLIGSAGAMLVLSLSLLVHGSTVVRKLATDTEVTELYSKDCAGCHGKDGRSKTFKAKFNHARNLTDGEWQANVSDERLFNSINNGRGSMPGWGKKLTQAQIESLVAYVRKLKV